MRINRRTALLSTLAGFFLPGPATARAGTYTYSTWAYSRQKDYYYRKCTFTNSNTHFYAIYKPSYTRQYVYCFNPYKRVYWCACPTVHHPSFKITAAFISIFIRATTQFDTIEATKLDTATTPSVPMKDAGGQQIGSLETMPTDLPPG